MRSCLMFVFILLTLSVSADASWLDILKKLFPSGLSKHRDKTIAESEFQPAQAPGMVVSNVNVFNGQPFYQIPLMGINVRGVIGWNFSLTYSGGVQPILDQPNSRSPSGWVGLGWNLALPYVAVSHNGTVSSMDDMLYCNLGPYGGGQIVQNNAGKYFLSTNPYIRIFPTLNSDGSQFQSWLFVFQDGNKMFFGETEDSRRTVRYRGNKIIADPVTVDQTGAYAYRWDASKFTDFRESNEIHFSYQQTMETISGSVGYTRESKPTKVYWTDSSGREVESINFSYVTLLPWEYDGYTAAVPRDQQRLYETQRLSGLSYKVEGRLYRSILFNYDQFAGTGKAIKRQLTSIADQMTGGESRTWNLSYDTAGIAPSYMLSKVEKPDHTTENFSYTALSLIGKAESPSTPDTMRNEAGEFISVPEGNVAKWTNSATCTEQFCFAEAFDSTTNVLYLQVYQNSGNYFQRILNKQFSDAEKKTLYYSNDYFVLADIDGREIDLWEWDGKAFVQKDTDIGDFFTTPSLLTGNIIQVNLEDNYLLVTEKNGGLYHVYPVVRSSVTGKWKMLGKTISCGFANLGNYGESVRNSSGSACLEWSDDENIIVSATADMFVVGHKETDIINLFRFTGSSFDELTRRSDVLPVLDDQQKTTDGTIYTMNFQKNLRAITLQNNLLILQMNRNGREYIGVFQFDGELFHTVSYANYDDGEDRGASTFYVSTNYMVEVAPWEAAVYLWRKKLSNGQIIYERGSSIFSIPDASSQYVYVSIHPEAFYLESRYTNGRATIKNGRYNNLLLEVPANPSADSVDWTSSLDANVQGLQFSYSDPLVFYFRGWQSGGSLCGEIGTCYFFHYSRSRFFSAGAFLGSETAEDYLSFGSEWLYPVQNQFSSPNRLIMRSVVNNVEGARWVLLGLGQYGGDNYIRPKNYNVVSRYWRSAGTGDSDETKNQYVAFRYGGVLAEIPLTTAEFGANTLSAQFFDAAVSNRSFVWPDSVLSHGNYSFIVDDVDSPLEGYNLNLQGTLKEQSQYDSYNMLRMKSRNVFRVDSGAGRGWPEGMVQNLQDSTDVWSYDTHGSSQRTISSNFLYDTLSGQPRLSIQNVGTQSIVNQIILKNQSFTIQDSSVIFRVPVQRVQYVPQILSNNIKDSIGSWNPDSIMFPAKVASMAKAVYSDSLPLQMDGTYRWAARDYSATDTDFRKGAVGIFRADTGFVPGGSIVSRNHWGQTLETETPTVSGRRHSCSVYEGPRSLPVAQFGGSACSDAAATTAENGPGLLTLQANGWEFPGVSVDSLQVYDGLYSYKVTDSFGPTRNIVLKEFGRYHYDYVISAWAYAPSTSVSPVLVAELRDASGNVVKEIRRTAPVDEVFQARRWQRWEIELTAGYLDSAGLFADTNAAGNYLRIWMGTGGSTGSTSNIVYVDDMVAYPLSASFGLASYRTDGQVLATTNANHELSHAIYDKNNVQRSGRDFKGRIFGDNALHYLEENGEVAP